MTKKKRDRNEERASAAQRELSGLGGPAQPKAYEERTGTGHGEHTELFQRYSKLRRLRIGDDDAAPSMTVSRARHAANTRWARARAAASGEGVPAAPAAPAGPSGSSPAPTKRKRRRGEMEDERGAHRNYEKSELIYWCEAIAEGRIKTTELNQLYNEDKIRISWNIAKSFIHGKKDYTKGSKEDRPWRPGMEPDAWRRLKAGDQDLKPVGRQPEVLTRAQEDMLVGIILVMAKQRKPIVKEEVQRWAAAHCAARNGGCWADDAG